jgi:alcohol-forming fatty acyl-CoA reductase
LTDNAPNTYTYTKHLAEQVCNYYKKEKNLPIVIYRPSIVSCKYFFSQKTKKILKINSKPFLLAAEKEPVPGWVDNFNGPIGSFMAVALGLCHVYPVKGERRLDYCTVDICIKGMIVASWKTWKEQDKTVEIPIYNAAKAVRPSFHSTAFINFSEYPPLKAISYIGTSMSTCPFRVWQIRIILDLIPALVLDLLLKLSGKKPKFVKFSTRFFI